MVNLPREQLKLVQAILSVHIPEFEVWAFGSRVTGHAKPYSYLDLVIRTDRPLPIERMALLKDALVESNLPIKVDVLDWSTTSESFRDIIHRNHVVIASAQDTASAKSC